MRRRISLHCRLLAGIVSLSLSLPALAFGLRQESARDTAGLEEDLRRALNPAARFRFAQPWDEKKSEEYTQRVLKELGPEGFDDSFRDNYRPLSYGSTPPAYDTVRYGVQKLYKVEPVANEPFEKQEVVYFIRVGPLFFIDESFYERLGSDLRREMGRNLIQVRNLGQTGIASLNDSKRGIFATHTYASIVQLVHMGIQGRRGIDSGVGDGMLLLAAGALGAGFLEGFDLDENRLAEAKIHLELNGYREGIDFHLFRGDLKDPEGIARQLVDRDSETVLISDIGTWPGSEDFEKPGLYSVTNADSMKLIPLIRNVTGFIGAGYLGWQASGNQWRWYLDALPGDQKQIRAEGFAPSDQKATYFDPIREEYAVAWSATRRLADASTAGLEESRDAMAALLDEAVPAVRTLTEAAQKVALLVDPQVSTLSDAEISDINRRFLKLLGYPVVHVDRLAGVGDYRAQGYQILQLVPDRADASADAENVYIQRPDPTEPIPVGILPAVLTGALARWQKAQGGILSSPIRLDAAPFLNARGLTRNEVWQLIADRFA